MARYISSVAVTLSSGDDLVVASLLLDPAVGCTISHAMSYVCKCPSVKSYLSRRYVIFNVTFKYSTI